MSRIGLVPAWLVLTAAAGGLEPAGAQSVLGKDEALRLAFPEPIAIVSATAYLTREQLASARALAGDAANLRQRVITYYVGWLADRPVGVAYFDAHRVRTLREVLMIVVSPDERVDRIEVLSFAEPPEYRAPEGWLGQFIGRGLEDGLSLKREVIAITGATLTSQAVTSATRRVLALHRVIRPFETGGS